MEDNKKVQDLPAKESSKKEAKEPPKPAEKATAVSSEEVNPTKLAELRKDLEKAEEKIKRRDKSLREVRAELKTLEETNEELEATNENNESYLKSLEKKLDDAHNEIAKKGKKLADIVGTVSSTFDALEITLNTSRKAVRFDLKDRSEQ